MDRSFVCLVCGFPGLTEPPRSTSGGGSYEICPSCGFEFGYDDDDQGWTYERWRERWVANGMPWEIPEWPKPAGWDPRAQLEALLGRGSDAAGGDGAEFRDSEPRDPP